MQKKKRFYIWSTYISRFFFCFFFLQNIKYGQVGTYNVDLKKFSPPDHTTLTIHTVQKNSDHTIHYIQRRIIYRD